jgi:hypothetical protein
MPKSKAPAAASVMSLQHVVDNFAYHVACLMEYRPGPSMVDKLDSVETGFYFGGDVAGCPSVHVKVTIRAALGMPDADGGKWGAWAQCTVDGVHVGNRCAARMRYSELCAPVIAFMAAYWAARAAAPANDHAAE